MKCLVNHGRPYEKKAMKQQYSRNGGEALTTKRVQPDGGI
jgi:hypothetical protein